MTRTSPIVARGRPIELRSDGHGEFGAEAEEGLRRILGKGLGFPRPQRGRLIKGRRWGDVAAPGPRSGAHAARVGSQHLAVGKPRRPGCLAI